MYSKFVVHKSLLNITIREHPQVRDVDMLHAPDYSCLEVGQLRTMLNARKKRICHCRNHCKILLHYSSCKGHVSVWEYFIPILHQKYLT